MRRLAASTLVATLATVTLLSSAMTASAAPPLPTADPFYTYSGSTPLGAITPGTVLTSRHLNMHLIGLPTLFPADQLLYRTTDELGAASATVATVIKPLVPVFPSPRVVSFQLAYDSLGALCDPSYLLGGGLNYQGVINQAELTAISTFLLQGYTVVTADYEGTKLHWVAGHESGYGTLDGIRAAINAEPELTGQTPVGMLGYSGGAIASQWAAELAPRYAPELNIVGTALGGVFVHMMHNVTYIDGSPIWSSVMPAVLLSLSRAYGVDLSPYLSDYGKQLTAQVDGKCIPDFIAHYPGLTVAEMVKPQYADVRTIPEFVRIVNNLIMGSQGTPTSPMMFAEGNLDGTGDGVMVAKDVQQLAYQYCQHGLAVRYTQYTGLEHGGTYVPYIASAELWLADRFAGRPAPSNCATLTPGNALDPLPTPPAVHPANSSAQAAAAQPAAARADLAVEPAAPVAAAPQEAAAPQPGSQQLALTAGDEPAQDRDGIPLWYVALFVAAAVAPVWTWRRAIARRTKRVS